MKDFIVWRKKWETGIKKIDEQHKHFVEIINRTYVINGAKKDRKKVESILGDLTEYARIHFSTEEEYFQETEYPDMKEHMEEHEKLLGKVLNFNKRFESKEDISKLVEDFLKFIREWLDDHLAQYDQKYVPWLTENGIK